jgi:SWI/SNF-related matrix-associated actin-dependent regulator of chromatin subfamily A3
MRCKSCPSCRLPYSPSKQKRIVTPPPYSSKVGAIVNEIRRVESQVVVFCDWQGMIPRLKTVMEELDISVVTLQGNSIHRMNYLTSFEKGNHKVLILPFATSGLNLNFVHRVIFVHPLHWKPNAELLEEQAIGRVLRLGQDQPVVVRRFYAVDTLEDIRVSCADSP